MKCDPILLTLIGLPGAGKSTWIKNNQPKWKNTVVVSPDEIRKELLGSINDQRNTYEIFRITKQLIVDHLKNGKNVVFDATNTDTTKRIPFNESIFNEVSFQKIAIIFHFSCKESKRRIRKDIENNVDRCNVPDIIINEQYKMFEDTLKSLPSEGFKIVTSWEEKHSCEWCGFEKDNVLGLCTKCFRFPKYKSL
jgi:predicted kinase